VSGELRRLIGEDYDPMRTAYDAAKGKRGTEGYDEAGYVDSVLADIQEKLAALKGAVEPEAEGAVEAAENAVEKAAAISGQTETPAPGDTADMEVGDWGEEELEAEYDKERKRGKQFF
jgi:hypothetical protein